MAELREIGVPHADDERRKEIVDILRGLLADAEKGLFIELVAIMKRADGNWEDVSTGMASTSEWIGKIEIAKINLVNDYLAKSYVKKETT